MEARTAEERAARDAARADVGERGGDERAREEVRGERGAVLLVELLLAAAEDTGDAGVHPEDVHGERGGEREGGCPGPAGGRARG